MRWPLLIAVAALAAPAFAAYQPGAVPGPDAVLMMVGNNVSRGGNFYAYYPISRKGVVIRKGDTLEYDLFIPKRSTEINGGVDIETSDSSSEFRDSNTKDQNGLRSHPDEIVDRAKDKWYHRVIGLDGFVGTQFGVWDLVFEGDTPGTYIVLVGKLGIHHSDGTWDWAYNGGPAPERAGNISNGGYSREIVLSAVERNWVTAENVDKAVADQVAIFRRQVDVEQFQNDLEYVEKFAKSAPDAASYQQYISAARAALDKVKADPNMSAEQLNALITSGREQLGHTHPLMQAFTGYLVGHSHIDFQWLWEWPESYEVCRSTFDTIANLMDEFPGFGFSQSSSALYKATQQYYPAVFKRIQEKVAKGTWDVVGGRVCEGDTNMISEESHARHFLLGQRYFKDAFSKTATVGWEPDTFGHTWSMPEILKMGGCDNYYFCRGGKGTPLFWWEGPDGSKVLAFDEPASGSWYDGNLSDETLNEVFPWYDKTGTNAIMWIYGVGDHGGGVTREQIQTARNWQKQPYYPNVKFATATKFFDVLRKGDLSKVPTLSTELNPVFNGCYTTHSDLKRLNRDAENITATAESAATIANLFGQPYPQQTFNDNWEGICFNHHHDTLPGSAIHESYVKSREQLSAIVASSRNIAGDSVRYLATFMKRADGAEYNVVAFNGLGWKHTGIVKVAWPYQPDGDKWVATAPDGTTVPVTIIRGLRPDNPTGEPMASFEAIDVPGFGYRVFGLRPAKDSDALTDKVTLTDGGIDRYGKITLENTRLRVTVNQANGLITSLFDKTANREMIVPGGAGNRLEIWKETPGGMSAWQLGAYAGHTSLDGPADVKVLDSSPGAAIVEIRRTYGASHITQHIVLRAGADQVETPVWVDWQEFGNGKDPAPLLKMACDVAGTDLKASYEIPYATIQRPANGEECVALKSADLSNADGGIALVNDSKSGHTAEGNTLRISLLRASYEPDHLADQREHFINMALAPHSGAYGAQQVKRGFEFNQEFVGARVPPSSNGSLPLEKSFVLVVGDNVISTVLKRGEDDPKSMLVRFYEANGTASPVTVSTDTPVAATRWMNFVENPLSALTTSAVTNADLHKYEIRNLMLYREKPRTAVVPAKAPAKIAKAPAKR